MDFLEKLNYLMEKENLNKSTLSKACGIPYTTIDGWYKKGYEGLKLVTLRKLAAFFGTSLDYWADIDNHVTTENNYNVTNTSQFLPSTIERLSIALNELNPEGQERVIEYAEDLVAGERYKKRNPHELGKKQV